MIGVTLGAIAQCEANVLSSWHVVIFEKYVKSSFAKHMTEMFDFRQGLVGVYSQGVIDGLSEAKSTLTVLITLKTQFWQAIPWKLAGMFH